MPPTDAVWHPDPHTLAKHELLRRYLGAWFPIMSRNEKKLVFIDGFAGPGVYSSGHPGSPIVALTTLLEHPHLSNMSGTDFMFLFVENDRARVALLEDELTKLWAAFGGQPTNVHVNIIEGEFEDAAAGLLASIRKGYVLAPAIAFVDPFGFKGVSLDAICRLTDFPKCEVIFNFMYDGLNRWITHPDESIHLNLRDLFGTDEYEEAAGLRPAARRRFLHDLYKEQLVQSGRFKFALDFEMVDTRGKNVCSLIFATGHIKGLEAMKSAMWKVDPSGSYRFSDRHQGSTLFDGTIEVGPLREAMLERFAGETVRVDTTLHRWVLEETIYGPTHYKKLVLKVLQEEGLLEPVSGQTKFGTFPSGTIVRFAASDE